jgi:hypothetical protein
MMENGGNAGMLQKDMCYPDFLKWRKSCRTAGEVDDYSWPNSGTEF